MRFSLVDRRIDLFCYFQGLYTKVYIYSRRPKKKMVFSRAHMLIERKYPNPTSIIYT